MAWVGASRAAVDTAPHLQRNGNYTVTEANKRWRWWCPHHSRQTHESRNQDPNFFFAQGEKKKDASLTNTKPTKQTNKNGSSLNHHHPVPYVPHCHARETSCIGCIALYIILPQRVLCHVHPLSIWDIGTTRAALSSLVALYMGMLFLSRLLQLLVMW